MMKPNSLKLLLFLLVAAIPCLADAQNTQKQQPPESEPEIENLITSGHYVFEARTALPMRGGMKVLTTDYDLVVSKDTIQAWLPYYGRAYQAPMDPSKGGIKFTSTDFDYKLTESKKGGWQVKIEPKDVKEVRQLTLNISKSGYASLQVISNHRQPISFNGKVLEK